MKILLKWLFDGRNMTVFYYVFGMHFFSKIFPFFKIEGVF